MWRFKYIKQSFEFGFVATPFAGVFVALIPFDEWWVGLIIICGVFLLSFFGTWIYYMFPLKNVLTKYSNHTIESMYGDILSIKKKKNIKPIIVIPVNTAFDYLVEDDLSRKDPIVSPISLHGKFIKKITSLDPQKMDALGHEIQQNIKELGLIKERTIKKRGNQDVYSLGSYIFIEREDYTYMLFALTHFDEHNNVIVEPVNKFVALINNLCSKLTSCHGRPVFIPVMGVGLSGFAIDHKHAYSIIKDTLLSKKMSLTSDVKIVIYDGDRQKVSIYD